MSPGAETPIIRADVLYFSGLVAMVAYFGNTDCLIGLFDGSPGIYSRYMVTALEYNAVLSTYNGRRRSLLVIHC